DHAELAPRGDLVAGLRKLDKDHVAELALGVVGDADTDVPAILMSPLVGLAEAVCRKVQILLPIPCCVGRTVAAPGPPAPPRRGSRFPALWTPGCPSRRNPSPPRDQV